MGRRTDEEGPPKPLFFFAASSASPLSPAAFAFLALLFTPPAVGGSSVTNCRAQQWTDGASRSTRSPYSLQAHADTIQRKRNTETVMREQGTRAPTLVLDKMSPSHPFHCAQHCPASRAHLSFILITSWCTIILHERRPSADDRPSISLLPSRRLALNPVVQLDISTTSIRSQFLQSACKEGYG